MTVDEILQEAENILVQNNLQEFGNHFNHIYVDMNVNIQIGHFSNAKLVLEKLSDTVNSPISDDGYTGIGIYEIDTAGQLEFKLDMNYILEYINVIKSFSINEGVSETDIEFILKRCIKLNELGFSSISLIYFPGMEEN